jgi:hypothetical protein
MKIIVAGKDQTEELGPAVRRQAEAMRRGDTNRRPAELPAVISALALRQTASESAYLNELLRLIRYREGVDTLPFHIPVRPGRLGRLLGRIKGLLWTLLRYQHDRIVFRQNLINSQLTSALEFESQARQREVADLARRVAELEKRIAPGSDPQRN